MSIFEFDNYRDYLRAYIRALGRKGHGEHTRIAGHLRISTTLLSQILTSRRHFNTDQACELAEYLNLTETEADYLYLLVEQERAGTAKNRAYLRRKIQQVREQAAQVAKRVRYDKELSESERSIFYSSWLYAAVQLFLGTKKSGVSLEEICHHFDLTRAKATKILHFLLQAGLSLEQGGKYLPGVQSTFVEAGSPHLLRHHANWRIKAIQKSETITEQELMFTAPISLSTQDVKKLRERFVQFIKEISDTVRESPAEEVANINIDFFLVGRG